MKYENETEQEVVSARISCQYEIMSVEDLTKDMPINDQENFWVIEKPYPTKAEVFIIILFQTQKSFLSLIFQILAMDEGEPKEYKASLWVREGERIRFGIKFITGSHVKPTFYLDGDTACNCAFPFRHNDVMFYGCDFSIDTADRKCPTEVDSNFNPVDPVGGWKSCKQGFGDNRLCPQQRRFIFLYN